MNEENVEPVENGSEKPSDSGAQRPLNWTATSNSVDKIAGKAPPDGIPAMLGKSRVGAVQYKTLVTKPYRDGFIGSYDFVINPYVGCTFGCEYCYASNLTTDLQKEHWGGWVQVKTNAVEQIRNHAKGALNRHNVYMATATDPYQPIERIAGVTRGILEAIADRHPKIRLVIQTRGTLVTRDIDLYRRIIEEGGNVQINMTVTTDDDTVRKTFEPGCSSIDARMRAITAMHEAGIQSCVTITPMLPMLDPGAFAERLLGTGITRFIMQQFRYASESNRRFIAQTDERATGKAMAHYGTQTEREAITRYNADYLRAARTITRRMAEEGGISLGFDRDGFKPPFENDAAGKAPIATAMSGRQPALV